MSLYFDNDLQLYSSEVFIHGDVEGRQLEIQLLTIPLAQMVVQSSCYASGLLCLGFSRASRYRQDLHRAEDSADIAAQPVQHREGREDGDHAATDTDRLFH